MSTYWIFIDDERLPRQVTWVDLPLVQWTIARSYDTFVSLIKAQGLPLHISFDHDLDPSHYDDINRAARAGTLATHVIDYDKLGTKTGYHCAQWLIGYCTEHNLDLPGITIHTMNPVGGLNIARLLRGYMEERQEARAAKHD